MKDFLFLGSYTFETQDCPAGVQRLWSAAMRLLFKILTAAEWAEALAQGSFTGSALDRKDGFIHLSAAHQARETAARHFTGREGLVLAAFEEGRLRNVMWEPSRGGDLFPHVYGAIDPTSAAWVKELPVIDGVHRFPDEVTA
jgi:uncharacterized protein (DUF952 family)